MEVLTLEKKKRSRPIPASLVCEELDGRLLYYKGYKDVLSGKKTKEEIMGGSGLQMELISYLVRLLTKLLDEKRHRVYGGEAGLHLAYRTNLSSNVCVYDKKILTPDKITTQYLDLPPKLVVEVDVSVELDSLTLSDYILSKTKSLLDFGTEKVVWILSRNKKVFVAEPGKDWYYTDWHNPVTLMDGIVCNVAEYLAAEGIEVGG